MSSGAERASFLVRTVSGASYRFDVGSSTNYIRQRITRASVEARSLRLKDDEVTLYHGSRSYNPMGLQHYLEESDTNKKDILIEAQFKRYPSLTQLSYLLCNHCDFAAAGTAQGWGIAIIWGLLGALWIAAFAQASFDLPQWWSDFLYGSGTGTTIPITWQTYAVLTLGTLTGFKASLLSGIFYWCFIAMGAPFAAQQSGGIDTLKYGSGGYFIGFILALAALGHWAEKGYDRVWWKTMGMMALANLIIYVPGLIWLPFGVAWKYEMDMGGMSDMVCNGGHGCVGTVFMWGLIPFIPGDLFKMMWAVVFCFAVWHLIGYCTSGKVQYSELAMTNVNSNSAADGRSDERTQGAYPTI